jgi:hypothetical protein
MIRKAWSWLLDRIRRPIGDGRGDVFFWRYRIFKTPILSMFVHVFERSDKDRCLHDHAWPFVSIILRDGYYEQVGNSWDAPRLTWYPPGSVLFRRADHAHRIEIKPGTRPVSLVIVGRKVRDWGFHTIRGWRKWIAGEPNPICSLDDPRAREGYGEPEPWEADRPGAWSEVPGAEDAPPHPRAETRPGRVEMALVPGLEPPRPPVVERGKVRATIYCTKCRAKRQIPWHGTNGGRCHECGTRFAPIPEEMMGLFAGSWDHKLQAIREANAELSGEIGGAEGDEGMRRKVIEWADEEVPKLLEVREVKLPSGPSRPLSGLSEVRGDRTRAVCPNCGANNRPYPHGAWDACQLCEACGTRLPIRKP